MSKEELAKIIAEHANWVRGEGGARANLSGANLSRADLSGANLYGANLSRADLSGATLSGATLSRANLSRANLYGANLSGADLSRANLYGANLSGADLSRADLSGANLSGADLSGSVHAWAQIAWNGHGECGRMLTAVIYKEGEDAAFQCGCFSGSAAELKSYIKGGDSNLSKSRTKAMKIVLDLLK
jgi:uncharacterized protein YjbI with pentapeptide repeats